MSVEEQPRRTVVVLGGYGKAGAAVANQLHELAPDIRIVVAGRRIEEAEQAARHVDKDRSGRVTAARVDIASASELDAVLAAADLCVAALPGSSVTDNLVEAVIRNRVHYLDLTRSPHLDPVLDQRVSDVEHAGVAIMRQAGLLPGSAAAVARYAASLMAEPVSVRVDTFLHDPDIPDAGIADLLEGARIRPERFQQGQWRTTSPVGITWHHAGEEFGNNPATLIHLDEMTPLPGQLGLSDMFTSASAPVAPGLVLALWRVVPRSLTATLRPFAIRAFRWASKRLTSRKSGGVISVTVAGYDPENPVKLIVRLTTQDGYRATGAAVAAYVVTMLHQPPSPGIHTAGAAIDVDEYIRHLQATGLDMSISGPEENVSFEFTESIDVPASPEEVWDVMVDVEDWWPKSNPEHESIERLTPGALRPGTRLLVHEKIAGIPGEIEGPIVTVDETERRLVWRGENARYDFFGLTLVVTEGVTWTIEAADHGSRVSARVWAKFPEGVFGRLAAAFFRWPLGGVRRDREHARAELRYLRDRFTSR